MKQTGTVDPRKPALFSLHGGGHKTVSAHDFQILFIPQDQVQVVVIIGINVTTFAAAFAHGAEGDFSQTSEFAQQRRVFLTITLPQIDNLTVRRLAQTFRLIEFTLE